MVMENVDFYRSYHTNPVNKMIHIFCIPLIVLTTINFLSFFTIHIVIPYIGIRYKDRHIYRTTFYIRGNLLHNLYLSYYFITWGWGIGTLMYFYIYILEDIGKRWREKDKNWLLHNTMVFAAAWILQFIGHAIEGNRPALLTSLHQSVFQAPLFTLEYIYPPLLQN